MSPLPENICDMPTQRNAAELSSVLSSSVRRKVVRPCRILDACASGAQDEFESLPFSLCVLRDLCGKEGLASC